MSEDEQARERVIQILDVCGQLQMSAEAAKQFTNSDLSVDQVRMRLGLSRTNGHDTSDHG